jgi:hypothetical protein
MADLQAAVEAEIQRVQSAVRRTAAVDADLPNQQVIADLDEVLGVVEVDGQVVLNWPLLFFHTLKAA